MRDTGMNESHGIIAILYIDTTCLAEHVNNVLTLLFKLLLLRQSAGTINHKKIPLCRIGNSNIGDDCRIYDIVLYENVPTSTK